MVMLQEEGSLRGVTVCDAGCGTGLLSIPLAKEGAIVYSSDISAAMVAEAEKQVGPSNSLNVVMLKS
ncbi:Magnesium protoporphyrin IX methyltransferase, chloroplastic [Linum perenne]